MQEAVALSLSHGHKEDQLFVFARALKAFEITTKKHLTATDLENAFSLWWTTAKPASAADADFDEWRYCFLDAYAKARTPLGANPLNEAISRADSMPHPPEAGRFNSANLKRLVAVCFHLQTLSGSDPFFLALRDVAWITDTTGLHRAGAFMRGLVRDGILHEHERGKPGGRRATRYLYRGPTDN